MKKYFRYEWKELNLNVDCTKCGNNIVLQEFEGHPTCNECGNINKTNWTSVLKKANLRDWNPGEDHVKKMFGSVEASVKLEPVSKLSCYHCKSKLEIEENADLKNYSCSSCKKPLTFKYFEELEDLVFYRNGSADSHTETLKMIAVRCVSCGAPLEADPTKTNFSCKFCSTENILPMSLRYKVVLDDVFVGEIINRIPKLLAFEKDGKLVKQALNENGKASFADAELDRVLIEKKNDVGVYNIITSNFKYLPPDTVLHEIFKTSTHASVINLVGTRLQKSPEEITARIEEFKPKPKENIQPTQPAKKEYRPKSFFKSPAFMILAAVIIVTLVLVYYNL